MADDNEIKRLLRNLTENQSKQSEDIVEIKVSVARQEEVLSGHTAHDELLDGMIKEELNQYNSLLREHIAGVMELKTQNALIRQEISQRDQLIQSALVIHNERIELAEKPIKWFQTTFFIMKWLAAAIAVVSGLVTLFYWLKGKM